MTRPSKSSGRPKDGKAAASRRSQRGVSRRVLLAGAISAGLASVAGLSGCGSKPHVLEPDDRIAIDRSAVEVPAGFDLEPYAVGLTGPVAMTFDADGNLIVAEGAIGEDPRIYGFTPNRKRFDIYPFEKPILPF